ncbi:MAG: Gfo/Idh/MocA family oxidoreductase [Solobacterium sp.]|nr:Gfo/Idh/MocA family oxidoreductase [Solobacterium sp.]
MDRIRFGIIGSGWRSLYYVRAALASADRFELCGMVCRRKEKAAVIAAEYGIPVFTDPQDLLKASPMFVVVAVDKAHVLEVSIEWLRKGIAVLAETPAAADIASLRLLRETIQSGKKLVTAEQYRLFPENRARLKLIGSGRIGEPSFLYLSLAHEYHAASLMRAFLQISPEIPFSVKAYSGMFDTVETLTRTERFTDGRTALKKRTCAVIAYADGKTCLYDFDSEQYRSPIRSSHWKLQGTRGEIFDDTVLWLDQNNCPQRAEILTRTRTIYTGSANPNLMQYETIDEISFENEILYTPDADLRGLAQDETAVAEILTRMYAYAAGEGKAPYAPEESIQDALLAVMMREAAETGKEQRSEDYF